MFEVIRPKPTARHDLAPSISFVRNKRTPSVSNKGFDSPAFVQGPAPKLPPSAAPAPRSDLDDD